MYNNIITKLRITAYSSSNSEDTYVDDLTVIGTITSNGAGTPTDFIALTDYSVYLANTDDKEVLAFSMNGAYIGDFVTAESGGLGRVWDVAFGPDGNLYATDNSNDVIRSYNGTTGSPISNSTGWATTVGDPYGLVWNGDELYVATSRGVEYFAANATALGYFGDAQRYPSTTGAPKLYAASDVVFCPDDIINSS